ncbi:MAG: tetratricopeptide repeat protein [Planctomycetaceae bacterium]
MPKVSAMLGRAYLGLNRLEPAEVELRRALALDDESFAAMVGLADLALQQGDLSAAREHFTTAEKLAHDHPDVARLRERLVPSRPSGPGSAVERPHTKCERVATRCVVARRCRPGER